MCKYLCISLVSLDTFCGFKWVKTCSKIHIRFIYGDITYFRLVISKEHTTNFENYANNRFFSNFFLEIFFFKFFFQIFFSNFFLIQIFFNSNFFSQNFFSNFFSKIIFQFLIKYFIICSFVPYNNYYNHH